MKTCVAAALLALTIGSGAATGRPDWYIAGESGDDANSGLVPGAPRRTFPADAEITTLDVLNVAEVCRSRLTTAGKVITVRQWEGHPQAWIAGDTPETSGWTRVGVTNAWEKNIGAFRSINNTGTHNDAGTERTGSVVHNWWTKIGPNGQHYGHFSYDTAANVALAGGTGRYNYEMATGVLRVNLGGASPNTPGQTVAWCAPVINNAVRLLEASGSRVSGINFALYPTGQGAGYAVRIEGCRAGATIVEGCVAHDMGAHAYGAIASNDVVFRDCAAYGLDAGGTHFIFHSPSNVVTVSGCEVRDSFVLGGRYRNFDNTGYIAGADPCAQAGVYAHGPGGGDPIRDVLVSGLTTDAGENGYGPVGASHVPPPGNGWDWSTYAMRVDGLVLSNGYFWNPPAHLATRRSILGLTNSGSASGGGGTLGPGASASWPVLLFESCAITSDADGLAFNPLIAVLVHGQDVRFLNSTIHEAATNAAEIHRMAAYNFLGNSAHIRARGCIFSFAVAGINQFCGDDAGSDGAHHDWMDNVYYPALTIWSANKAFDTQAEWTSVVDTAAVIEASQPLVNAPADLELSPASPTWTDRRSTGTIVPGAGINGPYRGMFGAYQYCPPDCNEDGVLSVADFGCFQTRFVAGDPYADCNEDSRFTVADFGCFQTKFASGCP